MLELATMRYVANYAHHITTGMPGFSDLPTALMYMYLFACKGNYCSLYEVKAEQKDAFSFFFEWLEDQIIHIFLKICKVLQKIGVIKKTSVNDKSCSTKLTLSNDLVNEKFAIFDDFLDNFGDRFEKELRVKVVSK